MVLIHKLVALLLLAAWLPVTSHCLLEKATATLVPSASCCNKSPHSSTSSHGTHACPDSPCDPAGPCNSIESATYKADAQEPVLPELPLTSVMLEFVTQQLCVIAALPEPIYTPPEFLPAWPFAYRVALPIRAPSIS